MYACVCGYFHIRKGGTLIAVLANKRHTSGIEYENTLIKFTRYMGCKLNKVPRRMSDYLANPLRNALGELNIIIMDLSEEYKAGNREAAKRYKLCKRALDLLKEIASLSYMYWYVSQAKNDLKFVRAKTRVFWSNFINREIALIIGVMKQCKGYKERDITIYHMNALVTEDFDKVMFIKKLSELNKIIFRRAVSMSKRYPDIQMGLLVSLSREALYCAIQGNIYPKTKQAYEMRKKYFNDLVNNIHKMNRPIKELAFNNIFSEKELCDMGNLMNDTLNIIMSLQKTDETRFGNL